MPENNITTPEALLSQLYRDDPVFFVEHALGHMTWSKQREILRSVAQNERTAVRASHGVSKTYTAAEVCVWAFEAFPESKVITTAPTWSQVEDLLWTEVGRIYRESRVMLAGECQTTQIKSAMSEHFAKGFATNKPARAEGFHAPVLFFIFDEAKGIPSWMWDAARGAMTGGLCRWLVISTTDGVQIGDPYYEVFKGDDQSWNKIHIEAHDSPYVTGETFRKLTIPDESRPDVFGVERVDSKDVVVQIASPKYIEACKRDWGEDSVLYQTKVKGEIVDVGADTIVKLSQMLRAFSNAKDPDYKPTPGAKQAGADVARGGTDDAVFYKCEGSVVSPPCVVSPKDMPATEKGIYLANRFEEYLGWDKSVIIKVDDTGVGGGLTDEMQRRGYQVIPVHFGQNAVDDEHYKNAIAEMWHSTAEIIGTLSVPFSQRLQTEMVNRKKKWEKAGTGRLDVESKDEYKARGFKSPDEADAFHLMIYQPSATLSTEFHRLKPRQFDADRQRYLNGR